MEVRHCLLREKDVAGSGMRVFPQWLYNNIIRIQAFYIKTNHIQKTSNSLLPKEVEVFICSPEFSGLRHTMNSLQHYCINPCTIITNSIIGNTHWK